MLWEGTHMMTLLQAIQSGQPTPRPLDERMNGLGLDVGAYLRFEPTMMAELQDACSACRETVRCQLDLAAHDDGRPAWSDCKDYCPNATRLNTLVALQFY
jgi:hypothetical protein